MYDNAAGHFAAMSQTATGECDFQELEHGLHNPDMAGSHYYLFYHLRKDYIALRMIKNCKQLIRTENCEKI